MSAGTAANGVCYSSQSEAAAMWCATVSAGTSAGHLTCANIVTALPSTVGGDTNFQWTRRTVAGDGTVTQSAVNGQTLLSCETYDLAYFSPVVSATVSALVAVLASRWVWRFFREDRVS